MNNTDNLITAGQLAKLAGTTKRTIHWYGQLGILTPVEINPEGYRLYSQSQVLDYQMILLLTTLGVTLKEIKQKNDLKVLFADKKTQIKSQIDTLRFNLKSLEKFMANLNHHQAMVNPAIKTLPPFGVYYLERNCSYIDIEKYCQELSNMFINQGKNFTTLAIFSTSSTYQPQKSLIKIGALARPSMVVDPKYANQIKYFDFNPGKVITYTHNGAGELLSLFWKELEKYCRLHKIAVRPDTPDFEIYRQVNRNPRLQFFDIYLPIE
ncbi:MAG: MerR family transcriptional regulator [Candidatus Shapirobacteria bacterium]|jgi:DNA-binding transcriptional MerR regulator